MRHECTPSVIKITTMFLCYYTLSSLFTNFFKIFQLFINDTLSIHHSFTLGSKPTFSTNPFHLNFSSLLLLYFMILGQVWTCHAHQFIFSFSFTFFLFVPCGRLGWLSVGFLLHDKYTVSYRIVSVCWLTSTCS